METSTSTSSSMDVADNPKGKSDYTATRQKEDVSVGKNTTNSVTIKDNIKKTQKLSKNGF